ncbi:hypothetical protein Tco_0796737 [Tanacetum coccineum]
MAESKNCSPQQPPHAHTCYGLTQAMFVTSLLKRRIATGKRLRLLSGLISCKDVKKAVLESSSPTVVARRRPRSIRENTLTVGLPPLTFAPSLNIAAYEPPPYCETGVVAGRNFVAEATAAAGQDQDAPLPPRAITLTLIMLMLIHLNRYIWDDTWCYVMCLPFADN